jgi:hypothetical protein
MKNLDIRALLLTKENIEALTPAKNMTSKQLLNEFDRVSSENPTESKRTIWDIFCFQNNIDESSESFISETFDTWSK